MPVSPAPCPRVQRWPPKPVPRSFLMLRPNFHQSAAFAALNLAVLLSTLINGQALDPGGMRPLQRPDSESVCWLSSDLRLRWSFRSVEKVDYISDVAGRRSISRSSDCPAARWEWKRGATKLRAPLILSIYHLKKNTTQLRHKT
jgi:hypothetical protein